MKTILAAVDLSDVSSRVVDEAGKLARTIGAKVCILHVEGLESGTLEYDPGTKEEQERISSYSGGTRIILESLANQLKEREIPVDLICKRGSPVWRILQEARKLNAESIVVGSHGHGNIYHFIAGTMASGAVGVRVRALAECPVVVVHSELRQVEMEEELPEGISRTPLGDISSTYWLASK